MNIKDLPKFIWLLGSRYSPWVKFLQWGNERIRLEEFYVFEGRILNIEGPITWGYDRYRRKDIPEVRI